MKKKLAVRYLGMVIDRFELESGEYSVGRAEDNQILIQHNSIHRHHGKITEDKGAWFYTDNTTQQTHKITNDSAINLSADIQLVTQKFVESEDTKVVYQNDLIHQRKNYRLTKALYSAVGLLILFSTAIAGYAIYKEYYAPMSANALLNRVKPQIVQFERIRDNRAMADYKELAGLEESDFRDNFGFCTGFLVAPNVILTASHCLLGHYVIDINDNFVVKSHDGKSHKIDRILGFDVKRDYLFLEAKGMESYGHLQFADNYNEGQKVFTVGNVHGQGVAIRDGIIASETSDLNDPDVKVVRYSAAASPGNSGGPLIDEKGNIVALVFASTYTENYNHGTSGKDLREGFKTYVLNQEPKDVLIDFKKVPNFNPQLVMQALSIPYLAHFDEYPELVEKYLALKATVKVPVVLEGFDSQLIELINTKILENYENLKTELFKKGELVLDWKSFASEKTPVILPSQFDMSQRYFIKGKDNKYYMKISGFIDSPSKKEFSNFLEGLEERKKFDFQSYGYNIEWFKEAYSILDGQLFYKPKFDPSAKPRLAALAQAVPYSQMWVLPEKNSSKDIQLDINVFLENFLTKEGVISNVTSPYVRPKSLKDFTIHKLSREPQISQVKDNMGRVWRKSYFKLFESNHLATYCIKRPQGDLCVGRLFDILNPNLFKTIESNFQNYVLSHLLINPYFWTPESILNFQSSADAKGITNFEGISLDGDGGYKVRLDGFGMAFQIPKQGLQSIRFQTGLYNNRGSTNWTGYGAEWITNYNGVDQVCGAGVEPKDTFSAWILNFWRETKNRQKIDSDIKDENVPKVWTRTGSAKDGSEINLYGYCSPLIENPLAPGQYFVEFKKSQPMSVKFFSTVN